MQIKANYHTHTARCRHAVGTDREYVESAIAAGIKTLGFADHIPHIYHDGYESRIRMDISQIGDYFASLTALKAEFADKIELHIGFEAEFYPDILRELEPVLADYPCEYLILGQHGVTSEKGPYIGAAFNDKKLLEAHTDATVAAIESGRFLYVAHPDIANFTGDENFYLRQARRICQAAKAADLPLEINMLGMRELRHYPRGLFFEAAAEEGNKLILGVDAHSPEHFTSEEALEAEKDCIDFAESFELEIVRKLL